jgi:hypothetical protein
VVRENFVGNLKLFSMMKLFSPPSLELQATMGSPLFSKISSFFVSKNTRKKLLGFLETCSSISMLYKLKILLTGKRLFSPTQSRFWLIEKSNNSLSPIESKMFFVSHVSWWQIYCSKPPEKRAFQIPKSSVSLTIIQNIRGGQKCVPKLPLPPTNFRLKTHRDAPDSAVLEVNPSFGFSTCLSSCCLLSLGQFLFLQTPLVLRNTTIIDLIRLKKKLLLSNWSFFIRISTQ